MMLMCFSVEAGCFVSPIVLSSVGLKRVSFLRHTICM